MLSTGRPSAGLRFYWRGMDVSSTKKRIPELEEISSRERRGLFDRCTDASLCREIGKSAPLRPFVKREVIPGQPCRGPHLKASSAMRRARIGTDVRCQDGAGYDVGPRRQRHRLWNR